ncbi:glucosamine-6-phosphate deaminase [Pseudalkalibacillus sp. Hm43]|uniref:glucosamine-6-phosphate deaminase n=1 Tax=Pseudalkalibacillus sp. Hm43 TaxID=3450742 RepID=UPI003F4329F9
MNIVTVKNDMQLSDVASSQILKAIENKPDLVLGIATGGTPAGTYQQLVKKVQLKSVDLSNIKTVNLDEYVGLARDHEESYWHYLHEHLYGPLELSPDQAIIPNGLNKKLEEECVRYEQAIQQVGGVDLQILGVGRNGHIGFNEPGTSLDSKTHVVELTDSTRQANARFFEDPSEVPTRAITVGISTIMKSRSILLLASGEEKAAAVSALLSGKIDKNWPVTILNEHPDVTLVVTEDAKAEEQGHAG